MSETASLFDENKATKLMDLYSRQIGTFGVETMKNLVQLRVLIIGAKGVGVETAKNAILAGPGAVTIYDNNPVQIADLGTNFFFNKDSVGKKRSAECVNQLKQLNPYVEVTSYTGDLSDEFITSFGAVIVTDHLPLEELIRINDLCHREKGSILFLLAVTYGVFASIFTDFGPAHLITDDSGEPGKVNVIEDLEVCKDEDGKAHIVITVVASKHGLDEDTEVHISDVDGMVEINDKKFKIKRIYKKMKDEKGKEREILVLNKLRVDHEDIAKWGKYHSNGVVTEQKASKEVKYLPLKESAHLPPINPEDFGMFRHPNEEKFYKSYGTQVHFALLGIWEFQKRKGHFPRLHNEEDAKNVVEICQEILENHKKNEGFVTLEKLDESLVKNAALYFSAELPGMTAFLGGVAAQEIIKKFGKYNPIYQWLHTDYTELLRENVPEDAKPIGSRYDHQISIFGKSFQDKIGKEKWFMVGCGALGCEYLKGFALMGLGANGGQILVTDMDTIEVSNLNRQFLFRKENVGQQKSVCAAAAAKKMNTEMNITCFEVPVGPDTENKFDDEFWSKINGVCNALDNIKAREYVDRRCVFYGIPLLEAGTLGTKANSELIIPHKTKSYSEHEKDTGEEEAIPMCTLRNFPNQIEHCIEWARAQFTELFEDPVNSYNKLQQNPAAFWKDLENTNEADTLDILEKVSKLVHWNPQGATFETAIKMAFAVFTEQYRDRIANLIHAFPKDSMKEDKDKGIKVPFWSGAKRFPRAAEYSTSDPLVLDFLFNASNLYAVMLNQEPIRDLKEFKVKLESMNLKFPEWQPSKKFMKQVQKEVKDEEAGATETQAAVPEVEDSQRIKEMKEELSKISENSISKNTVANFEKDDDTNFHIDFITASSNMRAFNYEIPIASRHKCKMIAGRIIPAVATTTAMITGLVSLELYKILLGLEVSKYCNANVNLGISQFSLFEPIAPLKAVKKYDVIEMEDTIPVPDGWTCWDKVVVDKGDLTVKEFLKVFPEVHHGCTLTNLIFKKGDEDKVIWLDFPIGDTQKAMVATNIDRKLTEIYAEIFGEMPKGKNYLIVDASVKTAKDECASVPIIEYIFRH